MEFLDLDVVGSSWIIIGWDEGRCWLVKELSYHIVISLVSSKSLPVEFLILGVEKILK